MKLPDKGNVLIIGYAATGKTTLCSQLEKQYPHAKIYHTDNYIKYGFEDALYVLMADLAKDISPLKIIEGILCYRLLRKGVQLESFYADFIINVTAPKDTRYFRIEKRGKDINATFNLDKVCNKIYDDYIQTVHKLPQIINYDSESN